MSDALDCGNEQLRGADVGASVLALTRWPARDAAHTGTGA